LFPTFALRYDQPRVPYYPHLPAFKGISHSEAYKAELSRIIDEVEPVECYGQAGDIVFWHHRLAHAAGQNYSEQIRQAVLADFWTNDLDTLRTKPVTANMWEDWSPALQRAG
jgi:ectoine hydroxylase-related dioxygenase (phytanoyl-CoA dioxygenase family)